MFSPPSQILTFSHVVGSGSVSITDVTTVTVRGKILFDPSLVGCYSCPFANVPIFLANFTGALSNTTSAVDGSFHFTASYGEIANVFIPDYYLGNSWTNKMVNWKNFLSLTTESNPCSLAVRSTSIHIMNAKSFLSTSLLAGISMMDV